MANRVMRMVTIAAACAVAMFAGCRGDGQVAPSEGDEMTSEQIHAALTGEWKLEAIGGTPVAPWAFPTPTLEMREAGRIGGRSSVNHWSATIDEAALGQGDVRMGPVISTLMAGSPEAMAVEHAYLQALGAARKIDLDELKAGTLRMTDVGGDEVLRFVRP